MGNRAVLRENMNKITRALCILMSVVTLSGCASQGTQGVSIADFAEHSVSTAAVPEVTSSAGVCAAVGRIVGGDNSGACRT